MYKVNNVNERLKAICVTTTTGRCPHGSSLFTNMSHSQHALYTTHPITTSSCWYTSFHGNWPLVLPGLQIIQVDRVHTGNTNILRKNKLCKFWWNNYSFVSLFHMCGHKYLGPSFKTVWSGIIQLTSYGWNPLPTIIDLWKET